MKNLYLLVVSAFLFSQAGAGSLDPAQSRLRKLNQHQKSNVQHPRYTLQPAAETALLIQLIDSVYYFDWDSKGEVFLNDPYNRVTNIVYDVNNNKLSQVVQSFDGVAWVNSGYDVNTYDANGNNLITTSQYWNGTAWENNARWTYTYDANNNELTETFESWNASAWENQQRYVRTFDANSNQLTEIEQTWNGSAWEDAYRYTYTYDGNNHVLTEVGAFWNGSVWTDDWDVDYTYDGNGDNTGGTAQTWNGSSWENAGHLIATYDANHNPLTYLIQNWNGGWVNSSRSTYTYDSNDNLLTEIDEEWDGTAWVLNFDASNTYDSNDFLVSQAGLSYESDGVTVQSGDSVHYYFHTVTGINDHSLAGLPVQVYPNPVENLLTVNVSAAASATTVYYTVQDINGKLLLSGDVAEQKFNVDVTTLSEGIYLLTVSDGVQITRHKIVKH